MGSLSQGQEHAIQLEATVENSAELTCLYILPLIGQAGSIGFSNKSMKKSSLIVPTRLFPVLCYRLSKCLTC